jgi:hypothetical protein
MNAQDTPAQSVRRAADAHSTAVAHQDQEAQKDPDAPYQPPSPDAVETELVDVSGLSLAALRAEKTSRMDESVDRILRQVDHSRTNVGGSGPPGRAD